MASIDYGFTWSEYSELPCWLPDTLVTTHRGPTTIVYLIEGGDSNDGKVWVSKNSLKTFELVTETAPFGSGGDISAVAISDSILHVYCTTEDQYETWTTRDSGKSWIKEEVPSIMLSCVVPFDDSIYAIAVKHKFSKWTDSPLVCSQDGGITWKAEWAPFAKFAKALVWDQPSSKLICFTDCRSFERSGGDRSWYMGRESWEESPDSWISAMPCSPPASRDDLKITAHWFCNGVIRITVEVCDDATESLTALYIPEDVSVIPREEEPDSKRSKPLGNPWEWFRCVGKDLFVIGETLFSRSVYSESCETIEASTDYGKTWSFYCTLPTGLIESKILSVSKDNVNLVYLIGGSRGDRFVGEVWVSRDLMRTFDCRLRNAEFEGRKVLASFARDNGIICAYCEKSDGNKKQCWTYVSGHEGWEDVLLNNQASPDFECIVPLQGLHYAFHSSDRSIFTSSDDGRSWPHQTWHSSQALVKDSASNRLYCFSNHPAKMYEASLACRKLEPVMDFSKSIPSGLTVFPEYVKIKSAMCFASGTILVQLSTTEAGPVIALFKPEKQ